MLLSQITLLLTQAAEESHDPAVAPWIVGLSAFLILMALLAWPQLVKAWRHQPDSPEAQTYYAVPAAVKWEYGTYYLVLAGYLAIM